MSAHSTCENSPDHIESQIYSGQWKGSIEIYLAFFHRYREICCRQSNHKVLVKFNQAAAPSFSWTLFFSLFLLLWDSSCLVADIPINIFGLYSNFQESLCSAWWGSFRSRLSQFVVSDSCVVPPASTWGHGLSKGDATLLSLVHLQQTEHYNITAKYLKGTKQIKKKIKSKNK